MRTRSRWALCGAVVLTLAGCGSDEAVNPLGGSGGSGGGSGGGGATGEGGGAGTAGSSGVGGGGGGAQGGVSFVEAGRYPASVGAGNEAVVHDDMNGDGVPDLVILNTLSNGFYEEHRHSFISVQIGAGDGTFQRIDTLLPGNYYVRSLATADVNGDGVRDVVVGALVNSQDVAAVLLGNGDGTLQAAVTYNALYCSYSVAASDLDGDGDIDLVLVGGSSRIAWLLGNGDGTFQSAKFVDITGNNSLVAVAVGDLNGDHFVDIVAADRSMSQVRVLQGTGGGNFQVLASIPAQPSGSIALGDLTGDGRPEVVLGTEYGSTEIGVLLNDGAGALQGFTRYPAGQKPVAPRVADVDGDGKADVVAVSRADAAAYVLHNAGGGALDPAVPHPGGEGAANAEVVDVNGDGVADLAIANEEPGLVVLPGEGGGAFGAPWEHRVGAGAWAVTLADLDGDGAPEIVFPSRGRSSVNVLRGAGDGTFAPAVRYPVVGDPSKLVAGHFDAGATLDLATGEMYCGDPCVGVEMLAGAGDGTLLPPVTWSETIMADVVAGDFNGDGLTDVVGAPNGEDLANILLAQGDGTASLGMSSWVTSVLAAGDFNEDGAEDLAAADFGFAFVLPGNGDGTFQDPPQVNIEERSDRRVTGDFNNDGHLDYLGTGYRLSLVLSAGDGVTFTHVVFDLNLGYLDSPAPADFDGDGWLDLALIAGDNVVVLWNAHGTFVAGPLLRLSGGPSSVVAGDVDGDGRPDLAVTNYASNDVAVLLNKAL